MSIVTSGENNTVKVEIDLVDMVQRVAKIETRLDHIEKTLENKASIRWNIAIAVGTVVLSSLTSYLLSR